MRRHKPELVMPAGDLDKLYTALLFGGDAVYVGCEEFSLRAYAGNFDFAELARGLEFAHHLGKKVYVAANILAHNRHLQDLPAFLERLAELAVDGLIVSDPGVMKMAAQYAPQIPLTVSTQANVTNYQSAMVFGDLGAKRIVLARELSLDEISLIKERTGLEVEVFVHGAMCVSYSGRCLLSYYMTGRSANQGRCAHPCRYRYSLQEEKRPGQYYPIEEDQNGTYILNSRDLCLIDFIWQLASIGVDAFKVEGRMKSPLYVGVTARVYREAIDSLTEKGRPDTKQLDEWHRELAAIANRPYTTGFVTGPSSELQDIEKGTLEGTRYEFCGVVKGYDEKKGWAEIEQRANFGPGDDLQLMIPPKKLLPFPIESLYDNNGLPLDRARHPQQRVFAPFPETVPPHSVLRRLKTRETP